MPTIPDTHIDLVRDGAVATLATIGPSGYPQVTAIGFVLDEDGLVAMTLGRRRQKSKNLLRDPRATLFFMDPANAYRTLEIRANAEILDDHDYHYAEAIIQKYNYDVREHDQDGDTRIWVRFHPVKINVFGS